MSGGAGRLSGRGSAPARPRRPCKGRWIFAHGEKTEGLATMRIFAETPPHPTSLRSATLPSRGGLFRATARFAPTQTKDVVVGGRPPVTSSRTPAIFGSFARCKGARRRSGETAENASQIISKEERAVQKHSVFFFCLRFTIYLQKKLLTITGVGGTLSLALDEWEC